VALIVIEVLIGRSGCREEHCEVVERIDGHADLADLGRGERMSEL
jgi:hypothetical protein